MTLDLIITAREDLTDRITLFTLAGATGSLPTYIPGSHLEFDLGKAGKRAYSLVDLVPLAPEPATYQIAVQREDGGEGGSKAMHDLTEGDTVAATAPKNDFALVPTDAPSLLLAGGIGVTPILSFATSLKSRDLPYKFHFTTRSAEITPFKDHLSRDHGPQFHLWHDNGNAIDLRDVIENTDRAAHIYCCGPKGMIDTVREIAESAGFAADHIHFELFTSAASAEGDEAFEVEIASTGEVYTIPADKTIIEALEDAGVDVMYDCQRGDCGICQVDVLEGTPDHRDVVLSEDERASGDVMQICVSRAKSARLKLDI
ncbi:PDR/VanB family oxidoreductase [Aliiroseovarius sp. 2305UL8-7]|uniref:PDR/VanB family oxidoreductase n=1 Tax=Aliiroseovarius conchicola TaxID=3121637 RepID=UPI00352979FC